MKRVLLLLLAASASALAHPSPESLRAAADYSAAHKGTALVVLQNGRVIFEQYPNGASRGTATKIYSGTKGFWNFAALAAQEDGFLDLDEKACATLPEWASDSKKSRLTLRELLNFSAGLNEAYSLHNDGWDNRDAYALKQPVLGSPGGTFIYGPTGLQCFHEVLKRKLASRGETPTHYLERRVLRPLGLGSQRYLADQAGNPLLAAGFAMTPSQWAKLGKAVLAGGAPVLHGSLGEALLGSAANPMFGLGFWNNRLASSPVSREVDPEELLHLKWQQQSWRNTCLSHAAPSDLVASVGSGGQRLYVIPSLSLVVVRQGYLTKFSDGVFLRALLGR
jgi:CubicO group peptidase (beta-lactamase class C family)